MVTWRRPLRVAAVAAAALGLLVAGLLVARQVGGSGDGQGLRIPTAAPSAGDTATDGPGPAAGRTWRTTQDEPPFVVGVSADGRTFVDQHGAPLLVRGDSPWSLLTDLTPDEARTYLERRHEQGFNAVVVALVGARANGAPSDDGATVDGLRPFVDGDVARLDDAYWDRVEATAEVARGLGITLFAYPVDGWSVGKAFAPETIDRCEAYGRAVGERFAHLPNLVWVVGGDYFPVTNDPAVGSDVDHCMAAAYAGLRAAGDTRPVSIQLGYPVSLSTDNPYWAPRVDWTFVYTYRPTYRAVLDAYATTPARPALFAEGNYENENNDAGTPPTTDETLRRQVLWALTSGSPGTFFGTDDWEFHPGWQERLDSSGAAAVQAAADVVAALRWWELVPDGGPASRDIGSRPLVVAGRGEPVSADEPADVLDDDYVTAAATPAGDQAVVYVPTSRQVVLDLGALRPGLTATWVDPASGAERPAGAGPAFTTPGPNSGGAGDWLLVLR